MSRAWMAVLLIALMAGACVPAGFADEEGTEAKWTLSLTKHYTSSTWTNEIGYRKQTISKLGFGLTNFFLGWIDLFNEPYEDHKAGKNLFVGIGHGLKDTVCNMLGGALHAVTFFIPVDVPLPDGGLLPDAPEFGNTPSH